MQISPWLKVDHRQVVFYRLCYGGARYAGYIYKALQLIAIKYIRLIGSSYNFFTHRKATPSVRRGRKATDLHIFSSDGCVTESPE